MTEDKNARKLMCPIKGFEDVSVTLPQHWLGEHCIKRDAAVLASKDYKNIEITNLSVSLHIADSWENIPGVPGQDPKDWALEKTPITIMAWLGEVVLSDFLADYNVQKNS